MTVQFDLTGCSKYKICSYRYLSSEGKQISAWFQIAKRIAIKAVESGNFQGYEATKL